MDSLIKQSRYNTFKVIIFFMSALILAAPATGLCSEESAQARFSFFGVGPGDDVKTAKEKLDQLGLVCLSGTADDLGVPFYEKIATASNSNPALLKLVKQNEEITKLSEIIANPYSEWEASKHMKILVFQCNHTGSNDFVYSLFSFSDFDQKLMSITVELKSKDLVRQRLIEKYGEEEAPDIWVRDDDLLAIYKANQRQFLIISDQKAITTFIDDFTKSVGSIKQKRKKEVDQAF